MRWTGLGCGGAGIGLGAFLGVLAAPATAVAQDFSLVTTVVHPNARENNEDRFGSGVAFSKGTLFVGAKDERGANDYSGVVHIFSDTDWSEVGQLKSSVDADIEFGATMRLDGDRALISNAAIDDGLVWFFEKVGEAWKEKLRVKGVVNEAFGYRLALRGDFAFVAASRVGTGNVHVYRRTSETWNEVQVLTASDAQDEDFFGYSIAFDGERLAVGAPGNMLGPKRCGVYTFSRQGDSFVEDGKLTGDPATNWFGADVGVSGNTLIVNAPAAYNVTTRGKALVYARRGEQWELDRELSVEDEPSFPLGVVIDGDTAWFGGRTADPKSQSVYAFPRVNGTWQQGQKLSFPLLGMYEIASWTIQDGTLAVGFWNGLRTESVQVYRSPNHQISNGGSGSSGNGGNGGGSAGSGGNSANGGGSTGSGGNSGSSGDSGAAGFTAKGGTNSGGTAGENSAVAGAGSSSSASGGTTGPSQPSDRAGFGGAALAGGSAAGQAAHTESPANCGCAVATEDARAWPFAALAFAVAMARARRTGRHDENPTRNAKA